LIAQATRVPGIERTHVADMQRARLLAATGQVACELGLPNVTVAHVVERAGVSRRTFYEVFSDSEDCLLNALQAAFERAQERVLPAWCSTETWSERLRRSLLELLCLFDEEPVLARLLIVESLAAGRTVLERRAKVLQAVVDAVEEGRAEDPVLDSSARVGAEGAVGGVLGVLHTRICQPKRGPLVELAGALMGMLVLPYRGPAAARRELTRAVPLIGALHEERESVALRADPFKQAGMRLTYRTMRVLETIGEHPGSSNRQIGERAEIGDQGQVSKLLARLERLALIANQSAGHGKGEPNVWALTRAGRQVTTEIRAHRERQSA
jgi:AcrR family transcriptional regulator/DNA-binding MarR family transcriptional regulator